MDMALFFFKLWLGRSESQMQLYMTLFGPNIKDTNDPDGFVISALLALAED